MLLHLPLNERLLNLREVCSALGGARCYLLFGADLVKISATSLSSDLSMELANAADPQERIFAKVLEVGLGGDIGDVAAHFCKILQGF